MPVRLLVLADPSTPELDVLRGLPEAVHVVAIGKSEASLKDVKEEDLATVEVLLNCGVGANAGSKADLLRLWPSLTALKWIHSASAGVEKLLFPQLVESPVILTNARGVYSHSLAEYALACCNWFAKDLPRMRAQQQAGRWEPFDVEELRGRTLGIVGLGDIGRATARLAKAFRMRVVATRRRTELTEEEQQEGAVEHIYPISNLPELMRVSDYVVAALPDTPATHKLVDRAAFQAMKPTGVFINVGRGVTVDEEALVEVLSSGKIRGAGLDVFYTEPLPADSPLYKLDNVLMSPHCADRTKQFQFESIEFFLENMKRYLGGEQLENIVDKTAGY